MRAYILTDKDIIDIKTQAILGDDIAIDDILENLNELPAPKKIDFDYSTPDDFYTNRAKYFVNIKLDEHRTEFNRFIEDNHFIKPEQPYYIKEGNIFDYGDLRQLFLESRNFPQKELKNRK